MESDTGRCISRLVPSLDPFSGNCCWGCHFLFTIVSLGQEITIRLDKKTASAVCNSTVHSGCSRQIHPHQSEKEIVYLYSAELSAFQMVLGIPTWLPVCAVKDLAWPEGICHICPWDGWEPSLRYWLLTMWQWDSVVTHVTTTPQSLMLHLSLTLCFLALYKSNI